MKKAEKAQMKQNETKSLSRIIGQLEAQIVNLDCSIKELKSSFDSIHNRVLTVEKHHAFMHGCVGVLLTLGGLLGVAIDHIIKWFCGK